ncbi:MAG: 2,3-bisphosphoglycerate-independent phosphoglycerate mutase [Clostridiales bacterium]|jgi:2,3-bisphosphoglycerate-independent phosphoglycerate mutase|uniref:2,3-bisphosphoglycerate-independent phosphoglycerate mutase n=1 Tax=Zhenhengia sp. TaxID=2944208 RepID=UPI00290BB596|nr:2,3-bisphosphoglycerate-independent phosphoglycerate mutase [Clostridiales bacterium]
MSKQTTLLLILDGFGINDLKDGNAIANANKPNLDRIMAKYPTVAGYASGMAVGLPDGQMGNSEVGHLNMGAGRIVYQELTRITKAIADGDFFENEALAGAMHNAKDNDKALHLFGLLSDGGVHSHNTHLYGLLEMAKKFGLTKVYVHAFLDGRDTAPASGKDFVAALEDKIKEIGVGEIATISGRYYAMDRDNRWDRVELAYNAIVNAQGETATDAVTAMADSYAKEVYDEFVLPTIITKDGQPVGKVEEGDSVIFFNFRPDRAREMTRAFCDDAFTGFERDRVNTYFVTFTQYDITIPNKEVAFTPQTLTNTFGEFLANAGKSQLRIAETEKYAHVTFFFNGGVEDSYENEDRVLVSSPKVATYDLQPEMSVNEVSDKLDDAIRSGKYDVIICNFANPDMVGHTGNMDAAVSAIEAVDAAVGKVITAIEETNGYAFICADHGNAEQMKDYETNGAFTAHTVNPVPFVLVNYKEGVTLKEGGKLADIAPTLIEMMGMEKPAEMDGESLLVK